MRVTRKGASESATWKEKSLSSKPRKHSKNQPSEKPLRSEIRGLLAAEYNYEEDDCLLQMYVDDDGIHLITVDFDMEIYYEWVIEPGGGLKRLYISSPFDVEEAE